ncbi:MAG: alpha/beta hydrolase [Acidimicrobiales bacterium]
MALDSATRALLDTMAAAGGKPLHECTPAEARAFGQALAELAGPAPAMREVLDCEAPGPSGPVPLRVLTPPQGARGVLVYLHGGGWVIGTVDEYDTLARKLAERTSCAVVLVEYRLAPEHRFPAAVEDCWAGLEWAAAHAEELTGRAQPALIVAGDSAGGNLAAVMAQRARDRQGPAVDLQVLIYPVTDAELDQASYVDPGNQLLLTREAMSWFWDHYVPDPARRLDPDASPLRAASLAGLPPAVVLTAEHDVLRDEGEAYAERLAKDGVAVELTRHLGQTHGFFSLLMLPGSERGFQQVVKAVRACIVRRSSTPAAPRA